MTGEDLKIFQCAVKGGNLQRGGRGDTSHCSARFEKRLFLNVELSTYLAFHRVRFCKNKCHSCKNKSNFTINYIKIRVI